MTGDDVDVVRGFLDDAVELEPRIAALATSLEHSDPVGDAAAPSLLLAHERALASVVAFVAAAERSVVELRAALEP